MQIDKALVTTAFELPGYRRRNFGVAGIGSAARIVGTIGASLQTLVGGTSPFTPNCAREGASMRIS